MKPIHTSKRTIKTTIPHGVVFVRAR